MGEKVAPKSELINPAGLLGTVSTTFGTTAVSVLASATVDAGGADVVGVSRRVAAEAG